GVVCAAGSVFVANTGDGTLTRIDTTIGRPKTLPITATELAYGAGSLWASQRAGNRVVRIHPRTGNVAPINVGHGPGGTAYCADAVWTATSMDGTVSRIAPATRRVTNTIPVGDGAHAIAVDRRGAWVSNEFGGTLARIDPRRNVVVGRIRVGNRPQAVALWSG